MHAHKSTAYRMCAHVHVHAHKEAWLQLRPQTRMEVIAYLVTLLLLSKYVVAQHEECDIDQITGNWVDTKSVPNSQLIYRIERSPDDISKLVAIAFTDNDSKAFPQWTTGNVVYTIDTPQITIQLDNLGTMNGFVVNACSDIMWTVPKGVVWAKTPRVENVHVVFMNHLDVGYAKFIGDIINEYFITYFPRAVNLGAMAEEWGNGFIYTTHPWLVSLYLDCPPNLEFNGIVVHCPDSDAIVAFEQAIANGRVTWHAGPMNMQVEFLDNVLLSAGLTIADNLDARFNKRPGSTVLSQRDVPGLTIAAIPILRKHGIKGVSVGVNPGSAPPDVPKIFLWQYHDSESVVGLWHPGGYPLDPGSDLKNAGGISMRDCTVAPGTVHALCFAFRTDNTGPPTSLEEVNKYYEILRQEFPEADVFASNLDNFVSNVSIINLPVVNDKEIGDNWIQGIASDPLKSSTYRAAALGLSRCLQAGDCSMKDKIVLDATRYLIKLPEHTWGLPGIHDTVNWSNIDFQKARQKDGDYKNNENSWIEQRTFLNLTLKVCQGHKLHDYIMESLADTKPILPDTSKFKEIDPSILIKLTNENITLRFNTSIGSINELTYQLSASKQVKLSNTQNQLGILTYHSYNETDYQFMNSHYDYYGNAGYDKPNSTMNANPESRVWPVKLTKIFQSTMDPNIFIVQLTMADDNSHIVYGAPSEIWITIQLIKEKGPTPVITLHYDMVIVGKNPTRLPEAMMFSFYPNPPVNSSGWTGYYSKINNDGSTEINAGSVVKNGSQYQHAVQYAKLYATRGVGYSVKMNSTHVPLVCPITGDGRSPTPFPSPLDPIPQGKVTGIAFNIHNNIWNTNYPLYYPYMEDDGNFRAKFSVAYGDL